MHANGPIMLHDAICARLPHAGRMCLLERLEAWDGESIVCLVVSHRAPENPLRNSGCLHAVCGVEYAAQTMALHGNLLAVPGTPPAIGYLARLRDLSLHVERLDNIVDDLRVEARRVGDSAQGFMYSFSIHAGARPLLSGRAMVKLMNSESLS